MNVIWLKYLPRFISVRLEGRHSLQAIIGNSGWLIADKLFRMGVGLFVAVWLARYLGPKQYGLWSFAIAYASLFSAFATLGLDGIVIKKLIEDPARKHELLGAAFVLKFVGGVSALLFALVGIYFMRPGEMLTLCLVGLSAAGFIFQSAKVVDFYFQAKVQSKYTVFAVNGAFVLMTLVKVILLLTSASLIAFAWTGLGESVLAAVFLAAAYRINHHKLGVWLFDWRVACELLKESWPLFLSGLAVILYMRVDMVMLERIAGNREVGIYAAATKISEILYFLPVIIVASVSPSIIKCYSVDNSIYVSRLRSLYFIMAWLAILATLPLSMLSGWVVSVLYGIEFMGAAPVLAIHLWASLAVFLGVASSQYLLIEQLQKISFYRTLIGLGCNIGLNLMLIPRLGAIGAAIATVVSYFIATFSLVFFKCTRRHTIYLLMAPFVRN